MIKKNFLPVLLFVVILTGLFGCSPAATIVETQVPTKVVPTEVPVIPTSTPTEILPTQAPVMEEFVFVDDMGNELTFSELPDAVVSISPSMTEMLFAIGAGEKLVGRDEMSVFPAEAVEVESVGSLWGGLPVEAILALEPDLVFAAEIILPEQVQALMDLGVPVYWQENPDSFDELFENIMDLAKILGKESEAETLISSLDSRVDEVLSLVDKVDSNPTVFYELDATEPANPWTSGGGTFIDTIITLVGGTNIATNLVGEYTQISSEELIKLNPEIILLADALYGVSPESVGERAGWDVISAVQTGKIYPIDPNLMSVPGPRLVDALEVTAKLLHPELFK